MTTDEAIGPTTLLSRLKPPRGWWKCALCFLGVLMAPAVVGGLIWCFVFFTQSRIVFIDAWPRYILGAWSFIVFPHYMIFELYPSSRIAVFRHPVPVAIAQWLAVLIPFCWAANRLPLKWQAGAAAAVILITGTIVLAYIYVSPLALQVDTYTQQLFHLEPLPELL